MIDPLEYSAGLPVPAPSAVSSYNPVVLDVPGRPLPLRLRVSFPAVGERLPVLLLSHGFGASTFLASQYGYEPLVQFLAGRGFVVVQPTHLSARMLQLSPDTEGPLHLRSRGEDLRHAIDRLGDIEAEVAALRGRLDSRRIAAVGHSLGGHTVGLVSGMSMRDGGGHAVSLLDDRIGARVLIAAPGSGAGLAAAAAGRMPQLATTDFSTMTPPALVMVGDDDHNPFFSDRDDWRADAYAASPGPKTLVTVRGAQHLFGGISGFDAAETTDEDPDRVAAVRAIIWAYLRSAVDPADDAFAVIRSAIDAAAEPVAVFRSR